MVSLGAIFRPEKRQSCPRAALIIMRCPVPTIFPTNGCYRPLNEYQVPATIGGTTERSYRRHLRLIRLAHGLASKWLRCDRVHVQSVLQSNCRNRAELSSQYTMRCPCEHPSHPGHEMLLPCQDRAQNWATVLR